VIDTRVLSDFLECAGAKKGDYYLLVGRGRVLAALPSEPEAFRRTLSLYRPQKPAARAWTAMILLLARARLQGWFLPSWKWSGATHSSLPPAGVLLGNPSHASSRCLFLLQEHGKWVVGKFHPGSVAPQNLEREKVLLQAAHSLGGYAPDFLGLVSLGNGWVLRTEFLEAAGRKPTWTEAISLMHAWLLPLPPRPPADFPLIAALPKTTLSLLSAVPNLSLRPCLRHGDFAPWNLLPSRGGGVKVVDWESGHREDGPGFDLVHYLLQEEFLVRRSAFQAAKVRILKWLRTPLAAEYLTASGWAGAEDILWELALAFESSTRKEIADWASSVPSGR